MPISLGAMTAIITGAGQDLGLAIARRFLEAGARVMLADADEKALLAAEAALEAEDDRLGRCHHVAQDRLSIANLITATIDRFGRIDMLVNAAPTNVEPGAFLDLETERFDAAFGDNVRGVFQLSQAVARKMIEQADPDGPEAGAIVNVSSIAPCRTVPEVLALSVTSAALDQLTRSMAAGLAPHGIRVNAVLVGGALGGVLAGRTAHREDEDPRTAMLRATPLGRLADAEEAADLALFVVSEQARHVTGQVIAVDGGCALLGPPASPAR